MNVQGDRPGRKPESRQCKKPVGVARRPTKIEDRGPDSGGERKGRRFPIDARVESKRRNLGHHIFKPAVADSIAPRQVDVSPSQQALAPGDQRPIDEPQRVVRRRPVEPRYFQHLTKLKSVWPFILIQRIRHEGGDRIARLGAQAQLASTAPGVGTKFPPRRQWEHFREKLGRVRNFQRHAATHH